MIKQYWGSEMKVLKETTKWDCKQSNHTYLVDDNKMIAYIIDGTTEPVFFKNPIMFNRKGRTFDTLKSNLFGVE